ncbi:MAG TPA: hypothetical protein VH639_27525 [Bryobacteraceae bacterium]|jgi:hypothetical protein
MDKTILVAALATAGSLWAQWPSYPTAAVPKDANGKPVLDAPTPRAADGHPDLSGVWAFRGNLRGQGGAGIASIPEQPAQTAPSGPPVAAFFNIGAGMRASLPLQPWAADLLKARTDEHSKDNPDAHCLPLGLTQLHMHPQPRKIIQNPDVTVILYEAQGGVRQIFTDGRLLPPRDAEPWWYGYSIGHWEGDTLVVETNGFRDDVWLDVNGSPLTNDGRMIERYRRPNYGTLQIDVTIDDAKVYTKPFTVRVNQRIMPDAELIEFICNENDRSGPHLVGK